MLGIQTATGGTKLSRALESDHLERVRTQAWLVGAGAFGIFSEQSLVEKIK